MSSEHEAIAFVFIPSNVHNSSRRRVRESSSVAI